MATSEIDNPPAAKEATRSAREFPRFVQLFSRQASGFANGSAETVEERIAWKPRKVVGGEPVPRRVREGARRQTESSRSR